MTDNINELTHEDWDRIDDEVYKAIEELYLFYKKWLESINQREVKWFISENALKEWENTDESK